MEQNILVVDDDDVLRLSLTRLLNKAGYSAEGRRSAKTALATMNLRVKQWTLVISDLRLPEMDGLEFLQQLKALQPQIPVILMTGYASEELEKRARELGAIAVLRKPFAVQELCRILESVVPNAAGQIKAAKESE